MYYNMLIDDYFEESYNEMKSHHNETLQRFLFSKSINNHETEENLTDMSSKFPKNIIDNDMYPISLHLQAQGILARLIARLSKKVKEQQTRFRNYSIIQDGTNVGEVSIDIIDETIVNIIWIQIYSKYQKNKYGQMALKLIIDEIFREGFQKVTLEVPGNSEDAHHIYYKFGFKDIELISDEDDVWGGLTSMSLDVNDYTNPDISVTTKSSLFEASKEGVYKENYYLRDNLQIPLVSPILAKRKNRDDIVAFVGKFLDDHYRELSTSGPVHIFMFGDKETNFLYEMFGVNGDQLFEMYNRMVDEAFYGKISAFFTGFIRNAPHKLLLTAMLIEALQKDYQDIVECCEYLWAFSEYPLVYRIYWKTGVKEELMTYTIEHLGSKFKVKKVPNLQALLKYDAHSSVVAKTDDLMKGVDNVYTDLCQRMRSQINNTFKNISRAYYDNDEKNATHHNTTTTFDDGTLADQEGHITNIAQSVDKTVSKFSTGEINVSIARIVADGSSVDKDNLIGYLNQINSAKNNRLPKLVENIITVYFNKNPTDTSLSSSEFLNFGLTMYRSIGTSKDPMYQEVKTILAMWMNDIINIRQYYNREATIISYTRAIFNYIIFMINHYN